MRLDTTQVEKPWGRNDLPDIFEPTPERRIGEIWFTASDRQDLPLLVKYLFTSERLSVQVHPDDAQGLAMGYGGGKSECWYILQAGPDSVLGLGLTREVPADVLHSAAQDGSIMNLIDWKPVTAGDFFYVPAGTIHAIGPDITIIEVQQNNDVTFRLFDYGRDRPLHLDESLTVSHNRPYVKQSPPRPLNGATMMLHEKDQPFSLQMMRSDEGAVTLPSGQCWFIPVEGAGTLNGERWSSGQCWYSDEGGYADFTTAGYAFIAAC